MSSRKLLNRQGSRLCRHRSAALALVLAAAFFCSVRTSGQTCTESIDSTGIQESQIDDFTEHTYVEDAGFIGSFADCTISRTFSGPIKDLRLTIVSGRADDIGFVGNLLVTDQPPSCEDISTVVAPIDITSQVSISDATATLVLRAQENCCCATGWGESTGSDRANARLHWEATIEQCPAGFTVPPSVKSVTSRVHPSEASKKRAAELEDLLSQVEPYIYIDSNGFERMRTVEARRAGVQGEAIGLALKLIALDNRVIAAAQRNEAADVRPEEFAFIEPLFLKIAQTDPCGTIRNPAACPPRVDSGRFFASRDEVIQHLQSLGFHQTSRYASWGLFGFDFTRVVPHPCGGSSFREQAIIRQQSACWTYNTQSPEPNPEVLEYSWPRLLWPGYVFWWHIFFC